MNFSQCPKCGQMVFQIESIAPVGSNTTIRSVICQACNSVVGTLDFNSSSDEQNDTKLQIQQLHKKLDTINQNMGKLMEGIKALYSKFNNGLKE